MVNMVKWLPTPRVAYQSITPSRQFFLLHLSSSLLHQHIHPFNLFMFSENRTPPISYAPLPTGTIPNATDYWYSVHSADTPQLTPVSKDHASNSDAARLRAARLQEFGWTALTVLTSVFVGVAAVLIV